jgi:asparagine synthase (glutamine-hydrolysing)
MFDPQTGNCITYNGETYNFKSLSETIRVNSRSKSDTEVVLHAYREHGFDTFAQLRGMFALAIWDAQKQELVLARDPFGVKPLYYYASEQLLIFASELRALLATGLIPRKLSRSGLDSYLANGSVTSPETIVEDVRQLMPGHYMQVHTTHSGVLEKTIAKFGGDRKAAAPPEGRKEAVALLRAALEDSVRAHLVSDVPLGVFLSGGMDSSALVALMSRAGDGRPKTFSVVFDEETFTEAPFARALAERFKTDHTEIRLSEQSMIQILPDAIAALDQPTMDGINTFVVSSAVKNAGITVALSGLGGDELFAGYPSFRRALEFGAIPALSKRILRVASGIGKVALNGSTQRHKFWQLANSDCAPADVYRISRQLFPAETVTRMTGRAAEPYRNGHEHSHDIVNTISSLELKGYMTNTLLRDTDAMSMAHSLEVRVPFVDTKVVDYVLSLPGEWKLSEHSRTPKPLLADALVDLLPPEFLARPKMGFTLPFEKWLQQNLRVEVSSVLEDPSRVPGLNTAAVRRVWSNFLEKPRAVGWSRPWSLYVLAKWCELNGVSPK